MIRISLIAALSENHVIGRAGKLPWNLPEDLKYFKKTTWGHPVIMGRKTYESMGKLLPGRTNIILTRQPNYLVPGAHIAKTLQDALSGLDGEVFVIGGGAIFKEALPLADRLYLTWVHATIKGDAFFPEWDRSRFKEIRREFHAEGSPPNTFLLLEKTP